MKNCLDCNKPIFKKEKVCTPCRVKKWRRKNPVHYAFLNLKSSASRRKIPFLITLDEFKIFISNNKHMERKHQTKRNSLTIDRIDEGGGLLFRKHSMPYKSGQRF